MATACAPAREWTASRTWRQFCKALVGVAVAVAVGCLLYAVETLLLRCRHRFIESPVEVMMRALGVAHFTVGWLFLLTSPRLYRPAPLARLAVCVAVGAGACTLYWLGGGSRNPFVLMCFYGLFLIHEVRDEAELFHGYGDAPDSRPGARRFVNALCLTVALGLFAVLAGALLVKGLVLRDTPALARVPAPALVAGWCAVLLAFALAAEQTLRHAVWAYGSLAAAAAAYRPLLGVYATILVLLGAGSLLGSTGLNLVIVLHVTAWLAFVRHRLAQGPPPPPGAWSWLRRTPAGFLSLHLAVIGVVLLLFALRVHAWERSGWLCHALSAACYPYWSLMHFATTSWRGK